MNAILRFCTYAVLLLLLLTGCSKNEESAQNNLNDAIRVMEQQDVQIREYIRKHDLTLQKDPSGIYYQIQEQGDSVHYMTLNSIPTIVYTRRSIDDKLLDASFGATDFDGRRLKDHIAGWQIGLMKISKGGKIFMIIPSPLAFGSQGVGTIIPPNSILVCEVELVDFK